MKWFLTTAMILCVAGDGVHAQGRENSLRDGAWALQFAITDFLDVDEFSGGVSFKWHLSPKSALRFGIEGGASTAELEVQDDPAEQENDGYSVSISPLYQRYVNPDADANFFWGAGPFFRFSNYSAEQKRDSTTAKSSDDSYSIGVSAVLGIEWFATKDISFHAEYVGSGEYRKDSSEDTFERVGYAVDTRREERSSWVVGTNGAVRFGLSVYF